MRGGVLVPCGKGEGGGDVSSDSNGGESCGEYGGRRVSTGGGGGGVIGIVVPANTRPQGREALGIASCSGAGTDNDNKKCDSGGDESSGGCGDSEVGQSAGDGGVIGMGVTEEFHSSVLGPRRSA